MVSDADGRFVNEQHNFEYISEVSTMCIIYVVSMTLFVSVQLSLYIYLMQISGNSKGRQSMGKVDEGISTCPPGC